MRPGQRIGKYILGEPIARGGMAEVWSARVEGPEGFVKPLALKFVLESFRGDSELERLFVNEARVAAQLQHANLVSVFDFDKIPDPDDVGGGRFYIAMERVDGYDLRRVGQDAHRRGRRLPPAVVLHIAGEVLKGLRHVHERRHNQTKRPLGLVHRDVSPHNILIGMGGEVKLSDFGIAKAMAQSFGTQSGLIRGKLAYASPEQLRNEPLDHRTDQFALAVTLWEGLAGRRLFDGGDAREIIAKVGVAEVPQLPREAGVDASVETVLRRMLSAQMKARFPSTAEALSAVLALPGYTADAAPLAALMGELFAPPARDLAPTLRLPESEERGGAGAVNAGLAATGLAETKTLDREPEVGVVRDSAKDHHDRPTANGRAGGRASGERPSGGKGPRDSGRSRGPSDSAREDRRGESRGRGGTGASGTRAVPIVRQRDPLSVTGSSYVSGAFPDDVLRLVRSRPSARAMAVFGAVAVVVIASIGVAVWQRPRDNDPMEFSAGAAPVPPPPVTEPTTNESDRPAARRAPEPNVMPPADAAAQAEIADPGTPGEFATGEQGHALVDDVQRRRLPRNDNRRDPTARQAEEQQPDQLAPSSVRAAKWPGSHSPAFAPMPPPSVSPSAPPPLVPRTSETPPAPSPATSAGVTPNGAPVLQ